MTNAPILYIAEAYDFYRKFIFNAEHQEVLASHGFRIAGSVASINWEVFASILTGDHGKIGYGSDLDNFEVKSSVGKSSFEYQYHLNGGKTKLEEDMIVNHIFVSYSPDYRDITVRVIEGKMLKPFFETWMPGLIENYRGENRKQRYRRSIPYGFVVANGKVVLQTLNGDLV